MIADRGRSGVDAVVFESDFVASGEEFEQLLEIHAFGAAGVEGEFLAEALLDDRSKTAQ